ncbi:hypothetical protein [Streptomyces sparsogenes]|nr:hypothetical protein [Streptomyces sparsogenes]
MRHRRPPAAERAALYAVRAARAGLALAVPAGLLALKPRRLKCGIS